MNRLGQGIVLAAGERVRGETHLRRLLFAALRLFGVNDARRIADCRRSRRHILHDHRVRSDLGARTDRQRSEHLGSCADHHAVFNRRVTPSLVPGSSAQRYAVIERHIVPNHRGFADDDPHPVIDEEAPADGCPRVDFDTGQEAREMRDRPPHPAQPQFPEPVRQTMQNHRMHSRITGQHLPRGTGCWIAVKDRTDVFAQAAEHV